MKIKCGVFSLILCSLLIVVSGVQADTKQRLSLTQKAQEERSYLVQLVNQLNAMMPLMRAAEKSQPKNQRVAFHYTAWKDSQGHLHPGLLEDVEAIKKGITQKLDGVPVEPRVVQAIQGDYLDGH